MVCIIHQGETGIHASHNPATFNSLTLLTPVPTPRHCPASRCRCLHRQSHLLYFVFPHTCIHIFSAASTLLPTVKPKLPYPYNPPTTPNTPNTPAPTAQPHLAVSVTSGGSHSAAAAHPGRRHLRGGLPRRSTRRCRDSRSPWRTLEGASG